MVYNTNSGQKNLEIWPILEITRIQKIEENEARTHFSDETFVNKPFTNTKECLCTVGHGNIHHCGK